MKNILCVLDNKADLEHLGSYIKKEKAGKNSFFYVSTLTLDSDFIEKVQARLINIDASKIVNFIESFHRNAFIYKDAFREFLSDYAAGRIGEKESLRKYFAHPSGKFSLWWLSIVAEQHTVKNKAYHDFAKLLTIYNFVHELKISEIYVDITSNALKKGIYGNRNSVKIIMARRRSGNDFYLWFYFIKALGYASLFIVRKLFLRLLFRRGARFAKGILKDARFIFVTYFPFADERALSQRIFKSRYFGPLQEDIEKKYPKKTFWAAIMQNNSRIDFKNINLAKKINAWGYRLFFPEELIALKDILKAIFIFFLIAFKYLLKIKDISRTFIFKSSNRNINLWALFADEWHYSFFGTYLITGLFNYYMFRRVLSQSPKDAICLYPAELFAWENALNFARRKTGIKTVGIQHTSVSRLFLNYFNTAEDLKADNPLDAFPMPDYLGCSGRVPLRLIAASGWPRDRIFDIGAVRFHRVSRNREGTIKWESRKKRIVAALSASKEEAEEMLLLIEQAFKDMPGCEVIVRPHYLCPVDRLAKDIGSSANKGSIFFDNTGSIDDLLISSRALIVTGSAASLNGIACQCPIIIPRLSSKADMNPISYIEEAKGIARYVYSPKELREAVEAIVGSEKNPIDPATFNSFIGDYLTICAAESEYFLRLEKKLKEK